MFTYNTIEVENFKFNNHHNLGDTNNVNEQNNIPNYHNKQNNSNLRNNQNIKYHNSEISRRYHIDSRPTYGAYIHNTLPRGPYLQYKFNDYKEIHNGCINKNDKLLSLSIPQLSSQSSSSTMTINDNNHSNNNNNNNNNNSDHYRINHNDLHNIDNTWQIKTPCSTQRQTQTLGRYNKSNNYFTTTNDIYYSTPRNLNGGNSKMSMPSSSLTQNTDLPNVTNMHARCISTSYDDVLRFNENALRAYPCRTDNGKRLKHLNEIGNRNGIVITESCYENELKLNMNKKTSTVISGKRITASDHTKSASNNGIYSNGSYNVNKKTISNHKNYVTLHDVLNVKIMGLNQSEGWALLCQSIQALQDLFLSDSNSFTRILPLINPSNLQITSRGRIALNLMPIEQERHNSNMLQHINGSPFKDIMDYLSPEYIKNIDQNKIYSIPDIEKMWIYSLGVTLQKTLQNSSDKIFSSDNNNANRINTNEKRHKTSLDFVISSMREKNIHQRASLMYLLDLNSDRTTYRRKPQSIESVEPAFNPDLFNFNKVNPNEIMLAIDFKNTKVIFMLNNSPLTNYHSLICPEPEKNHPQILNKFTIEFAIQFIRIVDDRKYRLGYNSPGALASVNHLHLHLIEIEHALFVETVPLTHLIKNFYKLDTILGGYCMIVQQTCNDDDDQNIEDLMKLIQFFKDNSVPHNLFLTIGQFESCRVIRILIFPRMHFIHQKENLHFNVGFCELVGYVSVGRADLYEQLNESFIMDCIMESIGDTSAFDNKIKNIFKIISEYCKTNNQHKPFSHIIIELFNEAITKNEISTYSYSPQHPQQQLNEQRSRDVPRNIAQRNSDLKVIRINSNENLPNHLYKSQPILVEQNIKNKPSDMPTDTKLQVVRKRGDILKKRKDSRRNTIHGTNIDLQTANKLYLENNLATINHKSTDTMNNIHCGNILNSTPELNFENMKALTLPNLKIRRYNSNVNKTATPKHGQGPEFITNSNQPVKVINLIDEKSINRRLVNVLLLNGQQLHIYCNGTSTTTYQLLETIIKLENIIDNFFLGLCTLIGGDFVFLPKELKISKIAPATWLQSGNKLNMNDIDLPLNLFMRIKFFLPKFRGSETLNSCNFLYFQLRKSVLERHILCTEDDLITLGGLALQAEVGDFEENMKYVEYFTISHYLPEEVYRKNKEMARYIRNSHLCKKGLRPSEARDNFVRFVQELKEYGLHLYTAKWIKEKQLLDIYLAISLSGICIFERNSMSLLIDPNTNSKTTYQRKIHETFDWMEIQNLNFSKHLLGINVRKNFKGNRCTTMKFKFKMCDKKSYFAFTLASEHHKFCLKLRKSFHSLKPLADELNIPIPCNSSVESSPNKLKRSSSSLNSLNEKSRSEPSLSQGGAFDDDIVKPKQNEKMNRFKNIKISMQNDNRLRKIKNKLLRRSNSSVENAVNKDKMEPSNNKLITKEENQNRENECPRVTIVEQSKTLKTQCNTMNRNKVKMGTRVFSPHFLSKSVDNILLNSSDLKPFNNNSFKCNKMIDIYDDTCSLVNLNTLKSPINSFTQLKHQHPTVIHSSIPTIHNSYYKDFVPTDDGNRSRSNGNFTLVNESISETLLEKFNNISCSKAGDRLIKTIFIKKDLITSLPKNRPTTILSKLSRYTPFKPANSFENAMDEPEPKPDRYTLGISIIEGKDNNVYVKDLIPNGPGERSGIKIGDQILAVNGISLFHIPYSESLKILQTTEIDVKLTVAQLIGYHVAAIKNNDDDNNIITVTSQNNHTEQRNYSHDTHSQQDASTLYSGHNNSINSNNTNERVNFTSQNIISKRILNLPKVISSNPEIYYQKTNKQSRRFDGHTIYPVTPAKLKTEYV